MLAHHLINTYMAFQCMGDDSGGVVPRQPILLWCVPWYLRCPAAAGAHLGAERVCVGRDGHGSSLLLEKQLFFLLIFFFF